MNSLKEGMRVKALIHNIKGKFKNGDEGTVILMDDQSVGIRFDHGAVVKVQNPHFYAPILPDENRF